MEKNKKLETIYFILAIGFALCGSVALYFMLPFSWLALALAANVFCAASVVCGTELKTISVRRVLPRLSEESFKDGGSSFSEGAGERGVVNQAVFRVPAFLFFFALLLAVVIGFASGSAWIGLLILFTWGGLGYQIARCVLSRFDFGLSMQTGLIGAGICTALAGGIQVFVSTPDHSFGLKNSIMWVSDSLKNYLSDSFSKLSAYLNAQNLEALPKESRTYIELLRGSLSDPALLASETVDQFISLVPGLFAVVVLSLLCIIWWGTKAALKRNTGFEVKYMGSLDHYIPSPMVVTAYIVSVFLEMLCPQGSALQIAGTSIVLVLSAVLAFSGFSLILFIINSRVRSAALRTVLIIGIPLVVLPTCGGSVLFLCGLLATWVDLRKLLGGGSLK